MDGALFAIFLLVLILPFRVKKIEHNIEAFLFIMGAAAVTVTGKWGLDLVKTAVEEPVKKGIVPAVLLAGLAFYYGRRPFEKAMGGFLRRVSLKNSVFLVIADPRAAVQRDNRDNGRDLPGRDRQPDAACAGRTRYTW